MTMVRTCAISACVCAVVLAQGPGPPAFEAATIKLSGDPPGSISGIYETKGRINAPNVTLKRCIRGAYSIPEPQIVGTPKWAGQDRYYIEAKAAAPAASHELMLMLQTLLADRFRLVLHREQRPLAGYRLVVAKGGLRAQPSAPDRGSTGQSRLGSIEAKAYTLEQFALKLSEVLQKPVLDKTGIRGRFDWKLEWTPDEMQAKPPLAAERDSATETGPSLFAALKEQLGLQLVSARVSADVLVIDSADRPVPD